MCALIIISSICLIWRKCVWFLSFCLSRSGLFLWLSVAIAIIVYNIHNAHIYKMNEHVDVAFLWDIHTHTYIEYFDLWRFRAEKNIPHTLPMTMSRAFFFWSCIVYLCFVRRAYVHHRLLRIPLSAHSPEYESKWDREKKIHTHTPSARSKWAGTHKSWSTFLLRKKSTRRVRICSSAEHSHIHWWPLSGALASCVIALRRDRSVSCLFVQKHISFLAWMAYECRESSAMGAHYPLDTFVTSN